MIFQHANVYTDTSILGEYNLGDLSYYNFGAKSLHQPSWM